VIDHPLRVAGVACLMALAACSSGTNDGPDGLLQLNNGGPGQEDTVVVAGEYIVDPERIVTFGIGTIENIGAEDITVLGVEPIKTFGDIELVDAIISGRDRESLWISSASTFPPDGDLGTTAPLAGYTLSPPTGPADFPNVNILIAYRVGPDSGVAGVLGSCVEYRVGERAARRQCWRGHQLLACEDIDAADCVVPEG